MQICTIQAGAYKFFIIAILAPMLSMASLSLADGEGEPPHSAPLFADGSVTVRDFPDNTEWKQITIRGEAAALLFESLRLTPQDSITRRDGTHFIVRLSSSLGCSRSDRHATPMYACVGFIKADGTTANGILDPEMGTVARIGVSN